MDSEKQDFSYNAALALKGIAVIMLLLHHAFRIPNYYEGFALSFAPFVEQQINNLTDSFKICVSIFAFISGYGLYLKYCNHIENKKSLSAWVLERYIKSFSGYWFVWVMVAITCQMIDERTTRILFSNGIYIGIVYGFIDFLGLSKLFDTPTLNSAWWYMSFVVTIIILTPLLYKCRNDLLFALTLYILLLRLIFGKNGDGMYPGNNSIYPFLISFMIGIAFARYGLFSLWTKIGAHSRFTKIYKCIVEIWFIILGYKFYQNVPRNMFWEYHYGIFATMVILFCVEFILMIPVIKEILEVLGKYSMNMFLTHSILLKYFNEFLYGKKHFILIALTFIVTSFLFAVLIDVLKRITRYNKYINLLLVKIGIIQLI